MGRPSNGDDRCKSVATGDDRRPLRLRLPRVDRVGIGSIPMRGASLGLSRKGIYG
jgi:hypothetical protein